MRVTWDSIAVHMSTKQTKVGRVPFIKCGYEKLLTGCFDSIAQYVQSMVKSTGKFHSRRVHEGPEGE
jgi:hypothetical protein